MSATKEVELTDLPSRVLRKVTKLTDPEEIEIWESKNGKDFFPSVKSQDQNTCPEEIFAEETDDNNDDTGHPVVNPVPILSPGYRLAKTLSREQRALEEDTSENPRILAAAEPGELDATEESSGGFKLITLLTIFSLSIGTLVFVYASFPELEEEEKVHVKFPTSIDDAKILGDILYRYKDKYFYQVLSGICVSYIFLQTFAIPGSIFLSIMSGFLFPFPVALLLICFCSATGASFCYLLSYFIGRRVVYKCFPQRAHTWAEAVKKHKDNLLNYIIFLRITPLIPNWFINITAPVLDVPLFPFWLGTFIGVGPPSVVAIQAGTTLHELSSANDAVSWTSITILLLVGLVSLIPVLMKDALNSQYG